MRYTPLHTLTNEELMVQVCNDDKATEREIELVERMEHLQGELEGADTEITVLESRLAVALDRLKAKAA